ncbi:TlpA family protein disulfide reductase [Sedimenticola sp.]|uniref:TlpA family protein disulfide reductase n=1 Tax=Sedimenticola sp. TaxID=1940285 RepID=UPI003D12BD26
MKIKEIAIAIFVLALIGLLTFVWFTPDGMKPAPAISVTTLKGEQISLQSLQGRPVLVTFWATTCPGCIKEMPHLAELYKELAPRGLEMIALAMSYDPENQVREMIKIKKPPYKVALDSDGKAALAFGDVKLTPTTFLIAPDGRIVQQKLGEMDMSALRNRILGMLAKKG